MVSASGTRIAWTDVPVAVQRGVEQILDGMVRSAVSQPGGFSPGTADRIVLTDGRRAFVKAVHAGLNADSVRLHRREAHIAGRLPAAAPTAGLLGTYDDGGWVALVFDDIDGRHPVTPWQTAEIAAVLTMLDTLAAATTPVPVSGLPAAGDLLQSDFAGWDRLGREPWMGLPKAAAEHLGELTARAEHGLAALAGDTLVHNDVRADNLLVRADHSVALVDWPHACRGCDWFDALCLLINVEFYGGHDVEELLAATPRVAGAPADAVSGVLAGLCGYFYDAARQPPPPGLPTLRQFQRAQADIVLAWLGRRLGW